MRKIKSINAIAILTVTIVMLAAGMLTLLLFFFLHRAGLSASPFLQFLMPILITVTIGSVLSAAMSELLLKPLNKLISAMKVVSDGDFSVRVDEIGATNELAELIEGFNRMSEELGGIEMFRSDFINNFSHEMKSPISSISGFAKQLKNEDLSPAKRGEYIDIIIEESDRLSKMSSNILMLTNYENRQIITGKTRFELDEQLRNCLILLEKDWSAKSLELNIALESVNITANQEMLAQLWLNLLDNAIKFSPEGGELRLGCRERDGRIEVETGDAGPGIPPEKQKQIFEKFYQGDSSHASKGNGLGLPIAKRVADLHNAEISLDSRPGNGTTFRVSLPVS